jgi:hypothetical protein
MVPAPTPDPTVSVIEEPIAPVPSPGVVYSTPPLDGQIVLEPLPDGVVACDALPTDSCGCGVDACGGCDAIGPCGAGGCGVDGCTMCGELCSPRAWRPCVTLCLPQDGWASFEFLSWYQDGMELPPLVTTNSDPDVPRAEAGVLTSPSTRILLGGEKVLDDNFDGGRLRVGIWLDRCHTWGFGGEYFELGSETRSFEASSTGNPVLARPFFNTQTGLEDSELIAFPNVLTGSVVAQARSEFKGGSFFFRRLRRCDEGCTQALFCGRPDHFCSRSEALFGYRYLQLDEGVQVVEDLVSTDSSNPGTFDILDRFETRNQFNGFDIGWMYRRTRGFWTLDALVRLAIGNSRQTVRISGETTVSDPNDPPAQTLEGGLLAQSSNIGVYQQNEFAVVPELGANVCYQLTDQFRVSLGYTFIYWSNVVRPGHHISRDLNPNLLPPAADPLSGALRPEFAFDTTDYWVQGLNVGLEYRW